MASSVTPAASGAALPGSQPGHHGAHGALPAAATLGALGIVYGDIGTSPLYAFKEAVRASTNHGQTMATPEAVLGITSLILWSLIVVISLKYAILIMRADNRGEGGIVALLALLNAREAKPGTWRAAVVIVGLIGAALLYGDGTIVPAISVLSAIEGLKVDTPRLAPLVVPLSLVVLAGLYLMQRKGTSFIGGIFGPVMLVWFVVLGLLGLASIMATPGVLVAVNPFLGLGYLVSGPPLVSFMVVGSVFLAVTGGEAMYADMGHFGRLPIRLAWFGIALPGLVLNYFGQGALLLRDPAAAVNPFYQLAPDWAHYPMIALATLAAVIASQAVISGAFSLTTQAIQLGFLPRMHIKHTDNTERGQIYVPMINWMLAAGTLGATIGFGSSEALAGAYGIAVSMLMAITTVLAAFVALQWGYPLAAVLATNGTFLVVELLFLSANFTKLFEGGWFPLVIAGSLAFLMLTWRSGHRLVEVARERIRVPDEEFLSRVKDCTVPMRLPGTAAFLTASTTGMPLALVHHMRHNRVLHERVLLVSVLTLDDPRAPESERVQIVPVGDGITRVIFRYGFTETPMVAQAMREVVAAGLLPGVENADDISYYLGRETVIPTDLTAGMAVWRERLYSFMHRNAERSAAYFCVPTSQVVEIGLEIEI